MFQTFRCRATVRNVKVKALHPQVCPKGKYGPLRVYLSDVATELCEVTLTFQSIEAILDCTLPPSARRHRAWWANPSSVHDHPHAEAWLASGWEVDTVDLRDEWTRFRRGSGQLT